MIKITEKQWDEIAHEFIDNGHFNSFVEAVRKLMEHMAKYTIVNKKEDAKRSKAE